MVRSFSGRQATVYYSRRSCLAILSAIVLSACSGSGIHQAIPLQEVQSSQTLALPGDDTDVQQMNVTAGRMFPDTAAGEHFLYVTVGTQQDTSQLLVYRLPLTSVSKPVTTISGFSFATGVAVGDTNIVVADNATSQLDFYFKDAGSNPFAFRCSRHYGEPGAGVFAVALHGTNLYTTIGEAERVAEFANGDGQGKPLPCNGESPIFNVGNAISRPSGAVADDRFVYVANFSSITAYAQPFSKEPPAITIPDGASPVEMAVTSTELYVTNYDNGRIDVFKLPLKNSSTPKTSVRLPKCNGNEVNGFGIALSPAPQPGVTPTRLYATDQCNNIYTYTLPLTKTSVPIVDTQTTNVFPQALAVR